VPGSAARRWRGRGAYGLLQTRWGPLPRLPAAPILGCASAGLALPAPHPGWQLIAARVASLALAAPALTQGNRRLLPQWHDDKVAAQQAHQRARCVQHRRHLRKHTIGVVHVQLRRHMPGAAARQCGGAQLAGPGAPHPGAAAPAATATCEDPSLLPTGAFLRSCFPEIVQKSPNADLHCADNSVFNISQQTSTLQIQVLS
jgi:hypothetical protein